MIQAKVDDEASAWPGELRHAVVPSMYVNEIAKLFTHAEILPRPIWPCVHR
jgi:hypothetical protein